MWLTCEAEKYLEENLERSHFNWWVILKN
jgi:hypothetical protein